MRNKRALSLLLVAASPVIGQVAVSPSTAALTPGQTLSMAATGSLPASTAIPYATAGQTPIAYATTGQTPIAYATGSAACTWSSSNPTVLSSNGGGSFTAHTATAPVTITLTCGSTVATAAAVVAATVTGSPITITAGGTYSGTYVSTNPSVPAVTIATDQPVILQNSFLSSKGMMIVVNGISAANVTVQNVTAVELDPGTSGTLRGEFMNATHVVSLNIHNVSMYGVSYGVELNGGTMTALSITKNAAYNLEDRPSDGAGGFRSTGRTLGHFLFLDTVTLPNGADIGWNTVVTNIGSASNEDAISIFKSVGTAANPINVHDNYIEGNSSVPATGTTGTGVIADGNGLAQLTGYVSINANTMVHLAGTGVAIASGHHVTAASNRIVSCGVTPQGVFYTAPFANAWYMDNQYSGAGSGNFYNNSVTGTYGGMIRPSGSNLPMVADSYADPATMLDTSNTVGTQSFTDPCRNSDGSINFSAEAAERAVWAAKVAAAAVLIGDQHTL